MKPYKDGEYIITETPFDGRYAKDLIRLVAVNADGEVVYSVQAKRPKTVRRFWMLYRDNIHRQMPEMSGPFATAIPPQAP